MTKKMNAYRPEWVGRYTTFEEIPRPGVPGVTITQSWRGSNGIDALATAPAFYGSGQTKSVAFLYITLSTHNGRIRFWEDMAGAV